MTDTAQEATIATKRRECVEIAAQLAKDITARVAGMNLPAEVGVEYRPLSGAGASITITIAGFGSLGVVVASNQRYTTSKTRPVWAWVTEARVACSSPSVRKSYKEKKGRLPFDAIITTVIELIPQVMQTRVERVALAGRMAELEAKLPDIGKQLNTLGLDGVHVNVTDDGYGMRISVKWGFTVDPDQVPGLLEMLAEARNDIGEALVKPAV